MTIAASNRRTSALARKGPSPRPGNKAIGANPRNLVNSLAKGLRVLESFTADRLEMTLSEIAV